MGIMFIYYEVSQPPGGTVQSSAAANFDYPYFTISLSLNILLTVMIITKFVLRSGNIRNAMGAPIGLRTAVITVIVESSALYAATYLLFIGLWSANSPVTFVFTQVLVNVQVRAAFASPCCDAFSRHCCLIIVMSRSLLRSSSFYESLPGER